ncbi:hypothetical protein PLESTB_001525500 [Pleodorina starrii]|uniref:Uncharacterized protein n=1 Tax=Pleodorina starrii TaxID=330485 RepID=A0A9W6F7V4_9CHLO|nr:hypothetical protein PLESTM_001168400 [Pleodorina starrii]GLC59712.1 hypothetical protein PLESTB_001525500 [Pleodorina starrii]
MDSQAQELTYNRTALDARGFATPTGGSRRHFWAISAFEVSDGTIISVVATCFDSSMWVGRCMAAEVVDQLADDLGAVLTEKELLSFIQEALAPASTTAGNNSNNNNSNNSNQRNAVPTPSQPQPYLSSQPAASQRVQSSSGSKEPSQQQQQPAHLAPQQQHQKDHQQHQQPALTLHLPPPPPPPSSQQPPQQPGGVSSEGGAFVEVTLPPSRFDGSDVTIRLPSRGNMIQVSGVEAQNACLTLVANVCQQLDEQRDELEALVSELARAAEENRMLRAHFAAAADVAEGSGSQGLTLRDQYGLAGAPPPPSGAAAKRPRNGGGASAGGLLQLQLQMQLQAAAGDGGGGGREFPVAFLSQPHRSQSQLPRPSSGFAALSWQLASQGGSGGGGSGRGTLLPSRSAPAVAAVPPPPPLPLAAGQAALQPPGPGLKTEAAELAAEGAGAGAVISSQEELRGGQTEVDGTAEQHEDEDEVDDADLAGSQQKSSLPAPAQPLPGEGSGGGGGRDAPPPAQRDPSRVGVTIRKTGTLGRGPMGRGGRGPPRR